MLLTLGITAVKLSLATCKDGEDDLQPSSEINFTIITSTSDPSVLGVAYTNEAHIIQVSAIN
jgi:hypothetical protein